MTRTTGAESLLSDAWIEAVLTTDSGIATAFSGYTADSVRVFEDVAPEGTDYPFITWAVQTQQDTVGAIGMNSRLMQNVNYIVKATAAVSSYRTLKPLADAIDAALDGASGTPTGGLVHGCKRVNEYRQSQQVGGQMIRELGGIFETWVQST